MSNIDVTQALKLAVEEANKHQAYVAMLQTINTLAKETERLKAEKENAQDDRDEALKELAQLQAKKEQAEREVQAAVDNVSNRIEDESKRVLAPLQKVKEELRTARAKAQLEKERLNREVGDLTATKAQLEGTIKKLESNITARRREEKSLDDEMTKTRDQFTQDKRDMEREIAKVGDTEQIKEEIRMARAKAITKKEAIASEIRDMKATQVTVSDQLAKLNGNLADRKREDEATAKAMTKTRDQYSQEKHALEEEIRQLKAKQIDLQAKNARLNKNGEARV